MTAKETLFGFRGRIARYTFFICGLVTIPLYPIAVFGFLIGVFTAHAGSIGVTSFREAAEEQQCTPHSRVDVEIWAEIDAP